MVWLFVERGDHVGPDCMRRGSTAGMAALLSEQDNAACLARAVWTCISKFYCHSRHLGAIF